MRLVLFRPLALGERSRQIRQLPCPSYINPWQMAAPGKLYAARNGWWTSYTSNEYGKTHSCDRYVVDYMQYHLISYVHSAQTDPNQSPNVNYLTNQ